MFDYGNNLRQRAYAQGVADAFAYPGFVPAYVRPLFCEGQGPFRWVALSGDPQDIYRTDQAMLELFPENEHLARWMRLARERVAFQGLPARICWLGYGERAPAGPGFNQPGGRGRVRAPRSGWARRRAAHRARRGGARSVSGPSSTRGPSNPDYS